MDKKMDRRILKTKRAIYNAFVELLSEKEINHITITDISKKADINRKTFYNYYSDIYEVMEEIENMMVDTFIKRLDTIEFTNMTDFLTETFGALANGTSSSPATISSVPVSGIVSVTSATVKPVPPLPV